MATNLRESLQEKARLANIGGDIRFGKWMDLKSKLAETELAELTDEAQDISEKEMKGGKWLDAAKFISSMFGPTGQLVSAGLNVADIIGTGHATKKWEKEFEKKGVPEAIKGTPLEGWFKQNLEGLKGQVGQSLSGKRAANLMTELIGGFTKGAKLPLFKGGEAKIMPSIMPSGEQALDFEGIPLDFLGGSSVEAAEKKSLMDIIAPEGGPMKKTLDELGFGIAEGLHETEIPGAQNIIDKTLESISGKPVKDVDLSKLYGAGRDITSGKDISPEKLGGLSKFLTTIFPAGSDARQRRAADIYEGILAETGGELSKAETNLLSATDMLSGLKGKLSGAEGDVLSMKDRLANYMLKDHEMGGKIPPELLHELAKSEQPIPGLQQQIAGLKQKIPGLAQPIPGLKAKFAEASQPFVAPPGAFEPEELSKYFAGIAERGGVTDWLKSKADVFSPEKQAVLEERLLGVKKGVRDITTKTLGKMEAPSLFNLAELGFQPIMRGLRGRRTPTSPAGPKLGRPSLRYSRGRIA